MSIQELGSIGEFVSSIAVLITLIYLAIQVRQNTQTMRVSATQEATKVGREVTSNVMTTPGMIEVFLKIQSGEELDPKETFLQALWAQNVLRAIESFYLNWKAGLVSDELWLSRRAGTSRAFAVISKQWWVENKDQYEPSFSEMIDEVWSEIESVDA